MSKPQSTKKTTFQFYTTREYFDELIVSIKGAKPGDRIVLMTMVFDPTDPTIAVLSRELIAAASRKVQVLLAIDAHSFLLHNSYVPGPLWARQSLPKRMGRAYKNKSQIIDAINSYPSSRAAIINHPKNRFDLPINNRSHIKIAIVNDRVFLGGCNLQASNWKDMMIGWKDPLISGHLSKLCSSIIERGHVGQELSWVDRCIRVSDGTDILIDAGQRGQSLIFEEALRLIDSAREWLCITGQFFPNSVTASHLLAATRRGVKVEVIYSHPLHHGLIGGLGQQVSILRERTRLPKVLFEHALARSDPMLHAKLIACDSGVMIGSHNYVRAGVFLGTAEIALKSNDETLAREAVKTLRRGLANTSSVR